MEDESAIYTLSRIIKDLLILLYPIAPHITEEMYERLYGDKMSIALENLPDTSDLEDDGEAQKLGEYIKKATSAIRTLKIQNRLAIPTPISVKIYGPDDFIAKIKIIEEDLKKTLKLIDIIYQENNEIKVELLSDHGS